MGWRGGGAVMGIAIGNSLARAAIYEDGQPALVPLEEGERAMPSAVLLHRMREVGKYAYLYSGTDPNLLITSINRILGRRYSDLEPELRGLQFEALNDRNRVRIVGQMGDLYAPVELYAMVLRKLRGAAERYLDRPVDRAVIAVPGSFDDFQRRSVRTASESVFERVKLINEPAAALIALSRREQLSREERLMTFDMGAGKCEVAILQNEGGRARIKAITGDTRLGGDDIDRLIFEHLSKRFERDHGESMIGDSSMARHEVMMAVQSAKHQLETTEEAEISVPFVNFDHFGNPLHLFGKISLKEVETLCSELMGRASLLIRQCLEDAHYPRLSKISLLGGSTRLPFIAQMVHRFAGQRPGRAHNPDELSTIGAALHAAQLSGLRNGVEIEDITAHSLGITTYTGGMGFVLKRQSTVPALTTKRFFTVERDQRDVHIEIREGEKNTARENRVIGEFWLPLPANLPRGSPIEVTIGKDEDGIVLVRARDSVSGNTREITITYDL